MTRPRLIDASRFPFGRNLDYESEEERGALDILTRRAWQRIRRLRWRRVDHLFLAFGVAPILALYLARFEPGGPPEDAERWVVVGDLPFMHFETDEIRTPAAALELYCVLAEWWSRNVLDGESLEDCYPIDADSSRENALTLLSRVEFIRTRLIPLARPRRVRRSVAGPTAAAAGSPGGGRKGPAGSR